MTRRFPVAFAAFALVVSACGGDDHNGTRPDPDDPAVIVDVKDGTWETTVVTRTVILKDHPFCRDLFGDLVPDPFTPVDTTETVTSSEVLCELTEDDIPLGEFANLPGCELVQEGTTLTVDCQQTIPGECPVLFTVTGDGTFSEESSTLTARLELRSDPTETCGGLLCYTEFTGTANWTSPEGTCPGTAQTAFGRDLTAALESLVRAAGIVQE